MGSGAWALLLLAFAHAQDPLPPAGVAGSVLFNVGPPPLDVGTFGTFSQTGPGGFVQLTASGQPGAFLSAEVEIATPFFGRASGTLIYHMQVVGPPGDVDVSVAVAGGASGSSASADPFEGFALKSWWELADVGLGLAPVFSEGIQTPALQGTFSESFGHTVDLTLTAGHLYRVTMVADAGAAARTTLAFGSAFIDPVFSFGPGVGPEYTFRFSEGVGNAAIPEPRIAALAGVSLLMLGLFRSGWRRLQRPTSEGWKTRDRQEAPEG